MAAGRKARGKSGLHKAMVPGNAWAGKPDGKRNREQTAHACMGKGEPVGSEPTRGLVTGPVWQAPPGAMPNRNLARVDRATDITAGQLWPKGSGWQLEAQG